MEETWEQDQDRGDVWSPEEAHEMWVALNREEWDRAYDPEPSEEELRLQAEEDLRALQSEIAEEEEYQASLVLPRFSAFELGLPTAEEIRADEDRQPDVNDGEDWRGYTPPFPRNRNGVHAWEPETPLVEWEDIEDPFDTPI